MSERKIVHVDMDAFFAAVEMRDNPSLRGKPLIIGALPEERGVVSTCSYEARKYGVRSAMNIKEAYRRCPHGIFMHGNMYKYVEASKTIHEIMKKYTDIIEFVALDEGYMDVTASEWLFGGAENIGRELKKQIFDSVGVTCSVGVSYSMMSAKIASEEKKPDGFFVIPDRAALLSLISGRPVGIIGGVGRKTEERLRHMGIVRVKDLLNTPKELLSPLGVQGTEILKRASGMDDREVVPESAAKSVGREHTFQQDITDTEMLEDTLFMLSSDVAYRLKKNGTRGRTVTLKIKYADMKGITRSKSGEASNSRRYIYSCASELLKRLRPTKAVRLIGVSVSGLQDEAAGEYRQLSLFDTPEADEAEEKTEALENTVYMLHAQYGRGMLKTGKELKIQKKAEKNKQGD